VDDKKLNAPEIANWILWVGRILWVVSALLGWVIHNILQCPIKDNFLLD